MVNETHIAILREGVEVWNMWREDNPLVRPNLSDEDLSGANLEEAQLSDAILQMANLSKANLRKADLSRANFFMANLSGADLRKACLVEAGLGGANLCEANLSEACTNRANLNHADLTGAVLNHAFIIEANLSEANLTEAKLICANLYKANLYKTNLFKANLNGAHLSQANLQDTDLSEADLSRANLTKAILVGVKLNNATLYDCKVFAVSAWGSVGLESAKQKDLVITPENESKIAVDDLEIAQFLYMIRENKRVQRVIDNVTSKIVLILGRFQKERKEVLDALREELKLRDFVPIIFDFNKPKARDFTDTVRMLAGLSLFVIADITAPKCSPLELEVVIPDYMVPFVPIIKEGEEPFTMFKDLKNKYEKWVLDLLEYDTLPGLIDVLDVAVIKPALKKHKELLEQKERDIVKRHIRDYRNK